MVRDGDVDASGGGIFDEKNWGMRMNSADAIIVGGGLAGLAAAAELGDRGKKVILLDQEPERFLGGQAFWSLGGLFMIDTPEQRRMGIKDSYDLALMDWMGSAQFDRDEDYWPRKWAEAYLEFAAGEMRPWLHDMGLRWFPVVGWAERGGSMADGHGNSVPRFHLTWGTGPGAMEHFERRVREHVAAGLIEMKFRHRVSLIIMENGAAKGVAGEVLAEDTAARGVQTNRDKTGEFEIYAPSVIVTSGGIGGNFDMVRKAWPRDRLGEPPKDMIAGVPFHVDGRMIPISEAAGGHVINGDRMWHYTEGVRNWDPIWPAHGIRILPGPSSMWFDATGNRLAAPCMPGFDTLTTLREILKTGYEYSWFVLTQKIIEKEFALSGSEQNPDLTSKKWIEVIKSRLLSRGGAPAPIEAFKKHGEDFVVADTLSELVADMNKLTEDALIDKGKLHAQIAARDAQIDNPFTKDAQVMAIHSARSYRGDRLVRTAKPHKFLDPANGPLIAVRLHILTRKSLGGLQTNLDSQMIAADGQVVPGLFAAGEVAGFGGGGYHGYNALEGTFLGGCIFSGRNAGRSKTIA
ncbi:MAG: putative oxidoreductase [Paracoccaceae bacterium]